MFSGNTPIRENPKTRIRANCHGAAKENQRERKGKSLARSRAHAHAREQMTAENKSQQITTAHATPRRAAQKHDSTQQTAGRKDKSGDTAAPAHDRFFVIS